MLSAPSFPLLAQVASRSVGPAHGTGILELMGAAHVVVQLVLFLLLASSVLCWAVIVLKFIEFRRARARGKAFLEVFWSAQSLGKIYEEAEKYDGSLEAGVFSAGYKELRQLSGVRGQPSRESLVRAVEVVGLTTVERALDNATNLGIERLERGLGVLATTSSAAPFIGLFGTVWGIMTAFQNLGIGGGSTTIQVVAGPIAEALIATAAGLAAAIPAVIFYNVFANRIRAFTAAMDRFRAEFLNLAQLQVLKDSG